MVRLRGASAESDRRYTCNQPTGTWPDFFSRYFMHPPYSIPLFAYSWSASVVLTPIDLIIDRTKKTGAEIREWSLIMTGGGGGAINMGGVGEVKFYHYEKGDWRKNIKPC